MKPVKTSLMQAQGLFLAIGQNPNTDLFSVSLKINTSGYIEVEDHSQQPPKKVFLPREMLKMLNLDKVWCLLLMDA